MGRPLDEPASEDGQLSAKCHRCGAVATGTTPMTTGGLVAFLAELARQGWGHGPKGYRLCAPCLLAWKEVERARRP